MTLQALKEAEFESSSLRVIPVEPRWVASLFELPLISYNFAVKGSEESTKVYYDIVSKRGDVLRGITSNNFRVIGNTMVNALGEMGIQMGKGDTRWWDTDLDFLAQTMQNLYNAKIRCDVNRRRHDGAAIHGNGAVFVPLPQGAALRIHQPDHQELGETWHVVIEGQMNFFGETRPFTITHAHCQGFEFPEIDKIMEEVMAALFAWFPFAERRVTVIDRKYVTNPVTHQSKVARG